MGSPRAWGALLVVSLWACGGDDDGSSGRPPDGGGGGPDGGGSIDGGGIDGGLEPRPLGGSRVNLYVSASGEEMVAIDLSDADIEALVDDGAGGYDSYPGEGHPDGTFAVPNLPTVSTVILRVNNLYVVTDRASLDLGANLLGRSDAQPVTMTPTELSFAVSQLDPWQQNDTLELFAPNTPASFIDPNFLDAADTPPQLDDTSLSFTVDFAGALEANLVDASAGDVAYLLRYGHPSGRRRHILTQVFQPAPFTMTDGDPTALSGSFTDVVLDRAASLDLRGSAYQAAAGELLAGPSAGASLSFTIYTSPFEIDRGDLGFIRLAEYAAPDLSDRVRSLSYGHPFPADWTPYELAFLFELSVIDDSPFTLALGVLSDTDVEGGLSGAPITYRLGPVGSPTIDDQDATQPIVGGAQTPTLAWAPPATGSAEQYRVIVRRVDGSFRGAQVATLLTAGTSLRLPAGLLASGQTYWFEIDALADPDADLAAAPFRQAGPRHSLSRRPTAPFTVE
jgi:hypothetical protein